MPKEEGALLRPCSILCQRAVPEKDLRHDLRQRAVEQGGDRVVPQEEGALSAVKRPRASHLSGVVGRDVRSL